MHNSENIDIPSIERIDKCTFTILSLRFAPCSSKKIKKQKTKPTHLLKIDKSSRFHNDRTLKSKRTKTPMEMHAFIYSAVKNANNLSKTVAICVYQCALLQLKKKIA